MEVIDNSKKYFESQLPEEKVILLIRRHYLAFLPYVAIAILIYLVGAILLFVIPLVAPSFVGGFAYNIYVLTTSLLFFFNTAFLFHNWVLHYLHVAILTDDHFVDIAQQGLFIRKVSQMSLDRIQDVSASQKGMIDTMFNVGTVDIQTAGEAPNFVMEHAPNPSAVAQKIMQIEDEYSERVGIRSDGTHRNANVGDRMNGQMQPSDGEEDMVGPPIIEYPVDDNR